MQNLDAEKVNTPEQTARQRKSLQCDTVVNCVSYYPHTACKHVLMQLFSAGNHLWATTEKLGIKVTMCVYLSFAGSV